MSFTNIKIFAVGLHGLGNLGYDKHQISFVGQVGVMPAVRLRGLEGFL